MKKLLLWIMILFMLLTSAVFAFAEEEEDYEVIRYWNRITVDFDPSLCDADGLEDALIRSGFTDRVWAVEGSAVYTAEPPEGVCGLVIDVRAPWRENSENILALRGDANPSVPAKNDFAHSSDLISYLKKDNDFCFLGACYPECHPESPSVIAEIKSLKKKVDAGAEVLLSQLFFSNDIFYRFHEECKIADIDVPVIPGVMPVINAAQIKRMVTLCHASFPERFRKIISRYEDNKEALFDAGMSYCLSQIIDLLVSDISGIHLYTMNNPLVARRICEGIRNIV